MLWGSVPRDADTRNRGSRDCRAHLLCLGQAREGAFLFRCQSRKIHFHPYPEDSFMSKELSSIA